MSFFKTDRTNRNQSLAALLAVIALAVVLVSFAGEASGASPDTIEDGTFVYEKNSDGTATVAGIVGGSLGYNIEVPQTVTRDGTTYTVTAIKEYVFQNNSTIVNVKLPSSLKTIGAGAFQQCLSLTTVDTLADVVTIEDNAFFYCPSLQSVGSLESAEKIGAKAFYNTKLTDVGVLEQIKTIGNEAFGNNMGITDIGFRDTLSSVGTWESGVKFAVDGAEIQPTAQNLAGKIFSGVGGVLNQTGVVNYVAVDLDRDQMNLGVGEARSLTATTIPSGLGVVWFSSDSSVATVGQTGKVTAVKEGTAVITAAIEGGKRAQCTVTVTSVVYSISLSSSAIELKEGASQKLTATVSPAGTSVSWSSSDSSVATVDSNGNVVAVKEGTAVITASIVDDRKAQCTVTVTKETYSVVLDTGSIDLKEGASQKLVATTTPAGTPVTWTSSDSSVATVDSDGNVKAVKAGNAVVIASVDGGNTAQCAVTVTAEATPEPEPEPESGGSDNTWIIIAAVAVLAIAVLALFLIKKKSS